jgi:hypothetical protein
MGDVDDSYAWFRLAVSSPRRGITETISNEWDSPFSMNSSITANFRFSIDSSCTRSSSPTEVPELCHGEDSSPNVVGLLILFVGLSILARRAKSADLLMLQE